MGGPWEEFSTQASAAPWEEFASPSVELRGSPDASPAETERMRRDFVRQEGSFRTRLKERVKADFDPYQPTVPADSTLDWATRVLPESITKLAPRMVAGIHGMVKGQTDPLVADLFNPNPNREPAYKQMERHAGNAVIGMAQGMAAPVGLMGADAAKEAWTTDPATSALTLAPFVPVAGSALRGVRNTAKVVLNPMQAIRSTADAVAQRVAGRQLKAARTTEGPLVGQYAKNAAEAEALQAETGLKFDPARASGDVNSIAALRQSLTKNGEAQALNEAQYLHNNTRLPEYINENMPKNGSLDDFLAAIERQKQGVANEATMAGQGALNAELALQGAGPEVVGSGLRDVAQGVRGSLKQQADALYAKVPQDMPMDSTPLYNSIQALGDTVDPAFANPANMPSGMMGRVKGALTPEPSPILGPNGSPLNLPQNPEAINFGQLMDYKAQVGAAERAAKAAGDYAKAYNLGQLRKGAEQTLKLAEESGQGASVDALRTANGFYRNTYVPTVRQGATSNVLKTTGTGGYAVDNALVGNQYFQQGAKGIEAAKSFKRTFGDSPEQLQAIQDYAFTSLKDANGGNLTSKGVDRWLYRHKEALNELGMTETFSGLRNKTLLAENAQKMQGVFDSSKAAKIIDSVDDKSKLESLFSGADAKDTGNTMKNVLRLVNGDEAALGGLKREFKDMILAKTNLLFEQDAAGMGGTSYKKLSDQLDKLDPAIELLYNAKEQKALSNARLAVQIENRAKKHAISGTSDTAALSTATNLAKAAERMAPLTWKYRAPKMVLDMFRQNIEGRAADNVARGLFDKSVADGFIHKFDKGYNLRPDFSSHPRAAAGGLMSNTLQDDSSRP